MVKTLCAVSQFKGWLIPCLFLLGAITPTVAFSQQADSRQIENIRVWHAPDKTRIVIDVSANVQYSTLELSNPDRFVIDISNAKFAAKLPELEQGNAHVAAIRSGSPKKGVLRIVLDLKKELDEHIFVLEPNDLYGHRLVLDLLEPNSVSARDLAELGMSNAPIIGEAEIKNKTGEVATKSETVQVADVELTAASVAVPTASAPRIQPFTVAIDAGHGGRDPGAIGYSGSYEKVTALAIARELSHLVNQDPNMRGVLIRDGDYFIKLHERRQKARKKNADVFVSIHVNASTKRRANGLSVFALSQRGATSAMARALAQKENAADLIGGVSLADKDEVLAKVLVDLSMTNTISESVNLGSRMLKTLGTVGRLHSKRVEQANFAVLKSPDMPSILVETGFITNPKEEKRLLRAKYRRKVAQALYDALKNYYQQTPHYSNQVIASPSIDASGRSQSTTSQRKKVVVRHKVSRGDSLSTIADRYGTTVRAIQKENGFSHRTAMLGVTLKIPTYKNIQASVNTNSSKQNSAPRKSLVHKVKRGDSLSKLSAKYNVTIRAIKRENKLKSNTLRLGQRITIPGAAQAKTEPTIHKVRRGDTLSEIAQKYNSTVKKIKAANNMRSSRVYLGQSLKIPG